MDGVCRQCAREVPWSSGDEGAGENEDDDDGDDGDEKLPAIKCLQALLLN